MAGILGLMGLSREAKITRSEILADWGGELPGLPLNYFADELPAAHRRGPTPASLHDLPVLRRCEVRARVRRGCFASVLSCTRDFIAGEIELFDEAVRRGRESHYEWGWAGRLPSAFRALYDRDFHRRMLALTTSMWERMEVGAFTEPRCTAEEILLSINLDDYASMLAGVGLPPGCVDLDELWLCDDDYLWLYAAEIAEREDVLVALESQFSARNLDFNSWFDPFDDSTSPGPTEM